MMLRQQIQLQVLRMATINPTGVWVQKGVHKTTWTGLLNSGDTVGAETAASLPDKTVYVTGTFASAVVNIEGSNNTATGPYSLLVDPQGNTISLTSTVRNETVLENTQFIRPLIAGSISTTGGTNLTVILLSRGNLR